MKPAVGMDNAKVSQNETLKLRNINAHNAKYGRMVFANCHKLFLVSGC